MAVAYIDARDVADRLDAAVGAHNWNDRYEQLDKGCVACYLAVRFDGEWVTKSDAGSPSQQPDPGDQLKAAFSDAFKRAAIKWGVGRYLYDLPKSWVDYDPKKRVIVNPPKLPSWALPDGLSAAAATVGLERGKELYALCGPAEVDPVAVINHYKVSDFDKLPAEAYQTIKNRLMSKIEERAS